MVSCKESCHAGDLTSTPMRLAEAEALVGIYALGGNVALCDGAAATVSSDPESDVLRISAASSLNFSGRFGSRGSHVVLGGSSMVRRSANAEHRRGGLGRRRRRRGHGVGEGRGLDEGGHAVVVEQGGSRGVRHRRIEVV